MALKDVNAVVTITTNAVKAIDDGKKLKQIYADINEQLNKMRSEGKTDTSEFKQMQKLAEDTKAKINEMLRGMELIDKVMGDISGHIGKDLNRALRETSKEFNKTSSSTDEGKAKLEKLRDVVADLKRELSDRRGLTMSLKDAETQLKNLNNASLDKLKQGLAAVREEAAKATDPAKQAQYQQYARNYEAQIAIKEHGAIGTAPATGSLKSEDRLRAEAERQRLVQAYQAASRSDDAAHKSWAAQALKEIQQYNSALSALTETERKYAQAQRDANSAADKKKEISNITDRLNKGEKVSLEELTEAHKHWQEQLKNAVGVNISQQDQQAIEILTNNIKLAEKSMKELRLQLDNIDVHKVAGNLQGSSIDELTAASKKGKEQFSMMKPGDKGYDQLREDLIAIDAEIERVTPKWSELAQAQQALAKATDVAQRAFYDEKVMLSELTEAQKTLEAQIKKSEGLSLDPADEKELEKAKMMLDGVNKALDEIALKDIDFENLDATPTEKLQVALKNLEAQEKRLAGFQKSDAEEIARKKALIQKQLEKNKLAVMDVARAEQIAAHSGSHNVQELKQAYEALQQKLLTLNTNQKKDIARTKEDMAKLKSKIDEVTGSVKVQSTIWQTAVRNITAYVGVFGAFNFIKNKIMQVFESNKQLSDSLANIRKVSGLTSEEINTLYTDIAKIDTRNSVEQLNELAYAGAKLGVQEHGGVKALTGFVRAAEQVQMALGEDLGEEALPALAKLTEVMGLMDQYGVEQAMQKAASAIFMLSTTSTSTGANIVEFSKRLMGLANVSHITSAELVALGSASDSMGLMAEVSSTAFNKVFTKIQSNTAAIEKAVGMAKGSLKSLVDEGKTMEAIVTVFDKMRDMSMEEMQRRGIFTALGSDGARLNNVMTTMADRVDMLKKHLETSNKAFEEGEAVIAEYMIQNQTAAAYIERASNAFDKAFTNPEGVDIVTDLAKQWHELSLEMTNSTVMMGSMKAALWAVLEVVKGLIYVLPVLIQFLLFKGTFAAVTQLVTGFWNMSKAIWAAVTASKALTAAQKWNGFTTGLSLLAAMVMTLKAAFDQIDESAERARQKQQELDKTFAESKDVVDKSTKSLDEYKTALDKSNLSQDERDKRLRAYMKNEYQPYLDFLGLEIDKVEDLADAYAQVTHAIKLKAAAEEKENYRSKVNGENRNNRIAAQAEAIREAKKAGFDIDKNFLDQNWEESSSELYKRITGGGANAYVTTRNLTFPKFGELMNALKSYQKIKGEETRIDRETDRMFNEEYKDLDLEHFSLEDFRKKQMEAQIQREKNRKNTVDMPPTKDELKAQRKAEAERRKALRAEMKEEQAQAKAIIDNVKNYYQRQINAITELANTTGMDPKLQEQMVNGMKERMNTALANVRKAIGGTKNQWEEFKQTMREDLYEPVDENGTNFSLELLDKVMDNNLDKLREMIQKLSQELNQQGSVLLDQILRKATENEGINAKIENVLMRARERELLEKNYTGKVDKDTEGVMEQFGIAAITDAQSKQIRDWSAQGDSQSIEKFLEMRTKYWQVAFGNARKNLLALLQQDVNTQQGREIVLQLLFGENWKEMLTGSELEGILNMTADQWQVFYMKLIEYTDRWTDAQKKAYDENKKRQDFIFKNRTDVMGLNSLELGYEQKAKANQRWGKPQTFAERMGLGSMESITNDPEVKMMEIRLTKAELYYKKMQELREADKISEEQLMDAKQQWSNAQEALMDKLAEQAKQKMEQIQQLLDPIKEFGAAAGDAMYLTINGLEGEGDAWRNAVKSIIKTYGEMTIKLIEEQLLKMLVLKQHHQEEEDEEQAHQDRMKQIRGQGDTNTLSTENLMNAQIFSLNKKAHKQEEQEQRKSEAAKAQIVGDGGDTMVDVAANVANQKTDIAAMEAQETEKIEQQQQATSLSGMISDTVAKVVLGIAGGSAQTVSELGWWGLPLVAVISAALMGLLNYALSTIGSSSGNKSNSPNRKVKLASGMLTYDSGNLQEVAGEGRSTAGRLLPTGRKNVQTVVGDDGRVYQAREQRSLPEGVSMVTEPIATRVNGQQALVGERGPEIVIGRKTTRAIQMNRPDLLRDLALIDRGITTRKVRTFDEGNLSDLASAIQPAADQPQQQSGQLDPATAEALRMLPASIAAFSQVMTAIQQQGIPAEIAMFDTSTRKGLRSQLRQADKMMAKYDR